MMATAPKSPGFSTTRLARIGSWYQARVDAGDLPGAVVAIVRNSKLAYLKAIGFQDRGKTIPLNPDTIFWIASMTKPVTSVAAMTLVDEGQLDLDAAVSRYLPELASIQVATEVTDAATVTTKFPPAPQKRPMTVRDLLYADNAIQILPVAHQAVSRKDCSSGTTTLALAPQKRPMTVRDLLRHTSGLIYPPQFIDSRIHRLYARRALFTRDTTLADFVASLGELPLAHQPGEVWEYSWGVDVLARVVEVASGQPFDQYLQARIFGPLHMIDTGFYVPKAKLDRLADPAPEGRAGLWDVTREPRLFSGGGGLVSTAADYLRFCQMMLNGGELDGVRILTPETVRLMTTNSLPPDIRFAHDIIGPATGASFGLGFAVRTDPETSRVPGSVGSFTWGGAWGTFFWVDPAEKLIAVQLIQVDPGASEPYWTAFRNLTYGALEIPTAPTFVTSARPTQVAMETLGEYVGRYYFGPATSSRDRQAPPIGPGVQITVEYGETHVTKTFDDSPASKAGVLAGDLISDLNGAPIKGLTLNQVLAKMRGPVGTELGVTIQRTGVDRPLELIIVRNAIRVPGVELQVRLDASKLIIESIGLWPILDFEQGKLVAVAAKSSTEFYVDEGDHTRIVFVRDAGGKVSGAVLNPGPWQQTGIRLD
jgi:CubicO group peptidase (beta-lactamase class C family)